MHQFQRHTGLLERCTPVRNWADITLSEVVTSETPVGPNAYAAFRRCLSGRFFFPIGDLPRSELLSQIAGQDASVRAVEVAEAICEGRFVYFSDKMFNLGSTPNWFLNPFNRKTAVRNEHWSRCCNFDMSFGDIKVIWEPSRFTWVYWLVRAYALNGDNRYPFRFWELLESWMEANPPQAGRNWQSGQEVALRAMAICFGLWTFREHEATTNERITWAPMLLSEHGRRIEAFIGHAIRQKNNHALSEGCGLFTIGTLFPELHKARAWRRIGKDTLEREALRQIYPDGAYVQHSMNYHRVMLQILTWGARLGELNGNSLSDRVIDRLGKAAHFLAAMLDPSTGGVPNYGANDGALVLPLDSCGYTDYRPAVQTAAFVALRKRILPSGPWDEPLTWLFGTECTVDTPAVDSHPAGCSFSDGGYYTLRSCDSWCMIRCHTYRDRPGHCDPLHVDLWWRGINLLRDSGTYSYFCPDRPDLENFFPSIAAHNTIEIDGQPPMRKVSRFMQVPWGRARTLSFDKRHWQGEHYGYQRAPWHVIHRRSVEMLENEWRFTDKLLGKEVHKAVLRWHLPWGEWAWDARTMTLKMGLDGQRITLKISTNHPLPSQLVVADPVDPKPPAVESCFYGRMEPQSVLEIHWQGDLPVKIVTRLIFEDCD
jgi:asparagine synthase (glutamine-hydrolysing)